MDRLMVTVSGVRGIVGSSLTPSVASYFGCAFGTMLGHGRTVVVGRDSRPSGPMVRNAVTAGLLATGVNVVDLGLVTTPGTALMTRKLAADGGVMITASHNGLPYNGMKFLRPSGVGLSADSAAELKEIWSAGRFALAAADAQGTASSIDTTHASHVQAVCDVVDVDRIAARGFRVALDSINGAGCVPTAVLLERLGCQVHAINDQPTGLFAHTPEPTPEHLEQLCQAVRDHRADVGFAQDPDADRLVLVDETGRCISEEYTLALATAFVLRHRTGKIAANLATSRMIDDVAAAHGCEVVRAPTGEANVVEAMQREGCFFGGEGNGGVIEPRVVPVRDSLVGIAYVLQYLAETRRPISALAAEIPSYVFLKTKVPCHPDAAQRLVARTRGLFGSRPEARLNDLDGLRVDLPEGWLSVRSSNTEPIVRIFAEAPDGQVAAALVAQVRGIAEQVLGQST